MRKNLSCTLKLLLFPQFPLEVRVNPLVLKISISSACGVLSSIQ